MKPSNSRIVFKSFKELKALFDRGSFPFPETSTKQGSRFPCPAATRENETELFRTAMADVTPLCPRQRTAKTVNSLPPKLPENNSDMEVLSHLKNLITHGEGFIVADTPEYMEGAGYRVHKQIIKRLHRGDFAIQAFIDLHGLSVGASREAFNTFLSEAIKSGKRAVLVIHGRGLSSPAEPVIKTQVYNWLTRGFWKKWVIAFSSARSCDGGAGATYVLLRQQPLTKQFRKKYKAL